MDRVTKELLRGPPGLPSWCHKLSASVSPLSPVQRWCLHLSHSVFTPRLSVRICICSGVGMKGPQKRALSWVCVCLPHASLFLSVSVGPFLWRVSGSLPPPSSSLSLSLGTAVSRPLPPSFPILLPPCLPLAPSALPRPFTDTSPQCSVPPLPGSGRGKHLSWRGDPPSSRPPLRPPPGPIHHPGWRLRRLICHCRPPPRQAIIPLAMARQRPPGGPA